MKSSDIDIDKILIALKKNAKKLSKHVSFAAVIIVLVAYVFMVWRISVLANSEPSDDEVLVAETANKIPKVNKEAVNQIQSLEQSNTDIHSLFDSARSNPFQE